MSSKIRSRTFRPSAFSTASNPSDALGDNLLIVAATEEVSQSCCCHIAKIINYEDSKWRQSLSHPWTNRNKYSFVLFLCNNTLMFK